MAVHEVSASGRRRTLQMIHSVRLRKMIFTCITRYLKEKPEILKTASNTGTALALAVGLFDVKRKLDGPRIAYAIPVISQI